MAEQQNENASAPAALSFGQIFWQMAEKLSAMEQEMADLKKNGNKLEKENEQMKTQMAQLWAENRELRASKADKNTLEKMSDCIAEMNIAIQCQHLTPNNKWAFEENEQYLSIVFVADSNGLGVEKYSARSNRKWNSIRAEKPVPDFKWNVTKPYIAFYFESKFVYVTDTKKIQVGFCDKKFPLNGTYIGNQNFSIGICHKGGMRVNGEFKPFAKINGEIDDFNGKVVGVGLIHSPANSSLKAFASCQGHYLGSIELPGNFCKLKLYPAASLFYKDDEIETNFGKSKWAFNPYQLVQ